jgi:drug/metabolite transporter (DMT)-like permease
LSPLVFSAVTLVDPAITGIISWLVGIEGVPDVYTWSGGIVVLGGVLIVIFGENQRRKEEAHETLSDDEL